MWEMQLANPLGQMSVRKLLTFVAATLVTIFSYLLLTSPTAYAADAKWEQGSIIYNNETYRGPTQPTPGHNLPDGSVLYTYLSPQVPFTPQTMHVIYFPPGADTANVDKANYVTYERAAAGGLSNKSSPKEISFDATTLPESQEAANPSTSSCKLDGIGWIVCPITTAIAVGMDWIFGLISGYLKVRPLDTVTTSTMYKAWSVMRNFANIVFVIAFLIVIYSQLTSMGVSNYGIKNMLPRLIIASILVNVSYWICAVGIDLSNVLGYSFQDLFINLRNTIVGSNGNSWDLLSWESVTGFILSGGAIGGAAIAGVMALNATLAGSFAVGGLALVLAPILLGAFLTVMVVLIILAARQAIVTLLVIIAPLAFVAYILPNTEKWFDKWRGLFMTMLIMFPAFSLIFGGSQLAGILIIQNATDINVVLFGMAVQIAPLAITPLLFKLSGSLLGRIAGIVNNPSKGILDRTKNWSKDRLDARRAEEMKKNRGLADKGLLGGGRNFSRRAALRYDNQKRLREGMKAYNEADANSLFMNSAQGRALNEAQFESNQLKERIENQVNSELKAKVNIEGSRLNIANINVELAKSELKNQDAVTAKQIAQYKTAEYIEKHANPLLFGAEAQSSLAALSAVEDQIAINGIAAQTAKRVGDNNFAKMMEDTKSAQIAAGGFEGTTGAQRALATALKTQQAAHQEAVSNAGVVISHGNFQDSQITDLALGTDGLTGDRTHIEVTKDVQEAAIKLIAGGKNAGEFIRLFKEIDIAGLEPDLRQELGDTALANPSKPKWLGAKTAGDIKQGKAPAPGRARIDEWVRGTVDGDKLGSAETLVGQDPDYLLEVALAVENKSVRESMQPAQRDKIKDQIHMALHDNRYSGRIGERDKNLARIYDALKDSKTDHGAPDTYEQAKKAPYKRK